MVLKQNMPSAQRKPGAPGMPNRLWNAVLGVLLAPLVFASAAVAWPTEAQWIPIPKDNSPLQDDNGDTAGAMNMVSDADHAAAFYYNDGSHLHFRMRLDQDPSGVGGQGFLQQFGWGVLIDADLSDPDYEYMVMLNGIPPSENIELWQNTVKGIAGSPADQPEVLLTNTPVANNIQISAADTSLNGDQDYFLDWRIDVDWFYPDSGIGQYDPIRLYFGSSPSGQTLTENGGDLVSGWSDFFLPNMAQPADGTVKFAADIAGNGDMTQAASGDPLYLLVSDSDRNGVDTSQETTTVTVTTAQGDSETFTLTETGADTGLFVISILPSTGFATPNDGTLQVLPGEVVTVTYIDAVDASINLNQPRTDTLTLYGPALSVAKTVSPDAAAAGGTATATYTITLTNSGQGSAVVQTITDTLPSGFTYIPGSASGLTASDPADNSGVLEWSGTWTVNAASGSADGAATLSFQVVASGVSGIYYNNVTVEGANFNTVSTGGTAPFTMTTPALALTKSADDSNPIPGAEIIYSIHYSNTGDGTAYNAVITDSVPANTSYIPGSLRIGDAGSSYASASPLTDAAADDQGEVSGATIIFLINQVDADDGADGSGTDEGIIYFKVTIN